MEGKYFNLKAVLGYGWRVMKANFWFFAGIGFIFLTITTLPDLLKGIVAFLPLQDTIQIIFFLILVFIGWLIKLVLAIGLIKIALCFFGEKTPGFSTLFNIRGCFWKYLIGTVLYDLIVYGAMTLFGISYGILASQFEIDTNDFVFYGGIGLLAIPAIIWAIKFGLYGYFVIDKNLGPIAALKASARTTKNIKWRLLGFYVLCIFIKFLGLFCLLIGSLATYPVVLIASTLVYRKLSSQTLELAEIGITEIPAFEITAGPIKRRTPVFGGIVVSAIFILSVVSIVALWSTDAEPIPDDYTVADLRSAPAEYNGSYEVLLSLTDEDEPELSGRPAIGLTAQDVNTIQRIGEVIKTEDYTDIAETLKANAADINQAWRNGQKGRNIVEELNTFPEIADLTELDWDTNIGFLSNLRSLIYLYKAYIYLEIENGNDLAAIDELIKIDTVFRKFSVNAQCVVANLVCIAGLAGDIEAANFIANNPKTSQQGLELLAGHFRPLTKEQTSMRNQLISEYLMFKKIITNEEPFQLLSVVAGTTENEPKAMQFLYKVGLRIFLRPNSTLRLYRNSCNQQLDKMEKDEKYEPEQLDVWPSIYPDFPQPPSVLEFDSEHPPLYLLYNMPGYFMSGILIPALDKIFEINTRVQIHDDLLQIVLNKRLGNDISLKARAYSDEYIIDTDKKKILSPGPDSKINTEDDITLTINPDFFR